MNCQVGSRFPENGNRRDYRFLGTEPAQTSGFPGTEPIPGSEFLGMEPEADTPTSHCTIGTRTLLN